MVCDGWRRTAPEVPREPDSAATSPLETGNSANKGEYGEKPVEQNKISGYKGVYKRCSRGG